MLEEHGRVIKKERIPFEHTVSYLERTVMSLDLNSMLTPKQLEINSRLSLPVWIL